MRVLLFIALAALVSGAVLADHHGGNKPNKAAIKKFIKAVKGRIARAKEDGEVEMEGKTKKFAMVVLGLVELDASGNPLEDTRVETRKNIRNMMSQNEEPLHFSEDEGGDGPVMGRCVSVAQDINGTTVTLRICVAKGNGTVNLGVGQETFDVAERNSKIDVTVEGYEMSAAGAKVCVLTQVKPPRGMAASCGARPSPAQNRRPKKCDLGDGTSMELSALSAEITGTDPNAADAAPMWKTLSEDDAKLEPKGGKLIGRFCFPKPAAGKNIWYDPQVEMEDDDYVDDGENDGGDGGSNTVRITMATVVMATVTSILFK